MKSRNKIFGLNSKMAHFESADASWIVDLSAFLSSIQFETVQPIVESIEFFYGFQFTGVDLKAWISGGRCY